MYGKVPSYIDSSCDLKGHGYLEENKILSKTKFRYRTEQSTELVALFLSDEISKEIDRKMVGASFFDLSKASDTLSHSILISKMRSCGKMVATLYWFVDSCLIAP